MIIILKMKEFVADVILRVGEKTKLFASFLLTSLSNVNICSYLKFIINKTPCSRILFSNCSLLKWFIIYFKKKDFFFNFFISNNWSKTNYML